MREDAGPARQRLDSIDDLRGLSLFLMLAANFLVLFSCRLPLLLNHAQRGMVLPLDVVAPLFGFAMGLSLPFTVLRTDSLSVRLIRRVLGLFVIGFVPNFIHRAISLGAAAPAVMRTWGILETWAVAYAVSAALMLCPPRWRQVLAAAMVITYQGLLLTNSDLLAGVRGLSEGGPLAAGLSWILLPVCGTVMVQWYLSYPWNRYVKRALVLCLLLLAVGGVMHLAAAPADRLSVSGAYVFLSAAAVGMMFLAVQRHPLSFVPLLRHLGRHPLLVWVLQGVVYVPVYFTVGMSYFSWPVGGIMAAASLVLVVYLALRLSRAGVTLRL